MTKEQKNKIALFRYGIISPLVSNPKQYKDNHSFLMNKVIKFGRIIMV